MNNFEDATVRQLEQLLYVVNSGKKRDWDWLIKWCEGYPFVPAASYTAEEVIGIYSSDEYWKGIYL